MHPTKKTGSQRTLHWLVFSLLLGIIAGIVAIPVLFGILPSDTSRARTILKTIRVKEGTTSNACFLGSSIVMNGINTRLLSSPKLTVLNFSSPGQKLMESSLILSQTSDNFHTIIVGASSTSLCTTETDIPDHKITSYMMYGYAMPKSYLELAQSIQADTLLEAARNPYLKNVIHGRWIVKDGLNVWVRNLLRKDLDLERSRKDMFYPSPYTTKVGSEALQLLLERYCSDSRQASESTITLESKLMLEYMAGQATKRGGRLILVILPEHPVIRQATEPEYYSHFQEQLRQLQENLPLETINCIDLLTREHFIDHIHPDYAGAQLLTAEVAKHLNQMHPVACKNGKSTVQL